MKDSHSDALSHWEDDNHKQDSTDDSPPQISPLQRSSIDSAAPLSSSGHWRDSTTVASDRRDTLNTVHTLHNEPPLLVEPNFDEGVLRALCELDVRPSLPNSAPPTHPSLFTQCGVPLLLDRIKQSTVSCRVRLFLWF